MSGDMFFGIALLIIAVANIIMYALYKRRGKKLREGSVPPMQDFGTCPKCGGPYLTHQNNCVDWVA